MAVETIDRVSTSIGGEAARVSAAVDALFGQLLGDSGDGRDRLYAALRHAAIGGGKRLRPLLTVAASRLFGIAEDRAVRVGTAIEAIHVYSLVHDDLPCMDDDDLRRGKPTVHKAFGEAIAVLAGDSLHAMAFEILADPRTHEDPFVRSDLVLELARASGGIRPMIAAASTANSISAPVFNCWSRVIAARSSFSLSAARSIICPPAIPAGPEARASSSTRSERTNGSSWVLGSARISNAIAWRLSPASTAIASPKAL